MKHLARLLLLLCVLVASCIVETPGSQTACEGSLRRVRMTFAVDDGFTPDERAELQQAVDDWFVNSESHVDFSLSYGLDVDEDHPHIYRVESWMQIVRNQDAKDTEPGKPTFEHLGWEAGIGAVFLVVDRMTSGDHLRYLAGHELGHAAGLSWPRCYSGDSKCHHSPDPHALMSPAFSNSPFNESDRQFCRASCLCP